MRQDIKRRKFIGKVTNIWKMNELLKQDSDGCLVDVKRVRDPHFKTWLYDNFFFQRAYIAENALDRMRRYW